MTDIVELVKRLDGRAKALSDASKASAAHLNSRRREYGDFAPKETGIEPEQTTEYKSARALEAQRAEIERLKADEDRIHEVRIEGPGFWHTCSGCHESEDGHDVGHYPHSEVFGCTVGSGCSECGGLGVSWDASDYTDIGKELERLRKPSPAITEGWQLVPVEPTRDMAEAARDWEQRVRKPGQDGSYLTFWQDAYRAMLSAAPSTGTVASAGVDSHHADGTSAVTVEKVNQPD